MLERLEILCSSKPHSTFRWCSVRSYNSSTDLRTVGLLSCRRIKTFPEELQNPNSISFLQPTSMTSSVRVRNHWTAYCTCLSSTTTKEKLTHFTSFRQPTYISSVSDHGAEETETTIFPKGDEQSWQTHGISTIRRYQ
jgi:hypothetical protein